MTEHEERVFEAKAEKDLRSQREVPRGRNFRAFALRFDTKEDMDNYRANFDAIFPNAPGAGI